MRTFHKILLNLVLAVTGLVVLYLYMTMDSSKISNAGYNGMGLTVSGATRNSSQTAASKDVVSVWCIFTKAAGNAPMRYKLRTFLHSLLTHSETVQVSLHIISDTSSRKVAQDAIQGLKETLSKEAQVSFYEVNHIARELKDLVATMQPHFSSQPGSYYSDSLFFLSLGLHLIAPTSQEKAIMIDIDTKVCSDIGELYSLFENFGNSTLFGLAPELSPVYRHVLFLYRSKNPTSKIGDSIMSGGYPGLNSGVILFHLDRLRNSSVYSSLLHSANVSALARKYSFKGHLGDQDFYTLMGFEHPELVTVLPCNWNRQLCTWWSDHGYRDVMPQYAFCEGEPHIWHGNCNTPIPIT